ncbi:MAG: helix-turn-helix domain-containing protein [Rickettsiales bacterium]
MTPQLTPELREQFGKLFVSVDPAVKNAQQRESLQARGVELYEKQFDMIHDITFIEGIPAPKLEIHAGKTLPSGNAASLLFHNESPIIRVAIDAANLSTALVNSLTDYRQRSADSVSAEDLEKNQAGKTIRGVDNSRIEQGESTGQQHGGIFRSPLDLIDGPDKTKYIQNTRRDVRKHQKMREEEPELWQFYLDKLFNELYTAHTPSDWLKLLRVHGGRTTKEMGDIIGITRPSYTDIENGKSYGGILPYKYCKKVLDANPFHWPTGDDGKVLPQYADKFLAKMGYNRQEQWHSGKHVRPGSDGKPRKPYKLDKGADDVAKDINTREDLEYYRHLRQHNRDKWLFWLDVLFSPAADNQTLPDWLRTIRVHGGCSVAQMESCMGDSTLYHYYDAGKLAGEALPYPYCEKILQQNPFHWPTDKEGAVREEYADHFLNKMGYRDHPIDWKTGKLKTDWADKVLAETPDKIKEKAILLLKALIAAKSLTNKDYTTRIGITEESFYTQLKRERPINYERLEATKTALDLDKDEERQLLKLTIPELNPAWLNHQQQEEQGGLLLKGYRIQAHLTKAQLAEKVGRHYATITKYETGKKPVPPEDIDQMISTFEQHKGGIEFDADYFRKTLEASNTAIAEKKKGMSTKSTQLGATHRTSAHPELSPDRGDEERGLGL